MPISSIITPKIRKGLAHLAILYIIVKALIIPFVWNSDFPANYFNFYNIPMLIVFFYLHTFLLLHILLKNSKPVKYSILTFVTFLIVFTTFLWIEAIRSSEIELYFTNIRPNPFNEFIELFSRKKTLFLFGFSFTIFWLTSFMYYLIIINITARKKIFSLKYIELAINGLVTGSLLLLPILTYNEEVVFYFIVMLLFFYINTFIITPVLLKAKQPKKYLLFVVLLFLTFIKGTQFLSNVTHFNLGPFPETIALSILFLLLFILSFVYGYVRLSILSKEQLFKLKLGAKDSELQLLKSQVNPHFLFNTLNTLYATALEENAPKTAESTAKLANLLRYMQNDITKDFIPLENEIKYLEDYISIQKLRCEVKPQVETIFKNCEGKRLSPGLFIPFVENAFKYGIDPSKPSQLKVSVICDASKINFVCVNSYDDNFNTYYKEQGFGMGIKNAKQRLDLVYPKNYTLDISKANHIFTVKLDITSNK